MSLLEVISKASAEDRKITSESEYPIILNSDDSLLNLKPKFENLDATALAIPVTGWQLSRFDTGLIDLSKKFFADLSFALEDANKFDKDVFLEILIPFLERIKEMVGISVGVNSSDKGYVPALFEKVSVFTGREAAGLILEACIRLEVWDLVKVLIVNGIVYHSSYPYMITKILEKKRSDLLCLSIRHAPDFRLPELLCILKYLLCPSDDARSSMVDVKKDWENQGLLAVEVASDKDISGEKLRVAKEAAVLLMLAHDGFYMSELCLHYLVASPNVDEVILSTAIGRLNGREMMNLIKYLGKWFKKYEMFPQAAPCPEASSLLFLKACDSVPTLDNVVRWLGVVLDENFSSLVLHPEFHEELISVEGLVRDLSSEAELSFPLESFITHLRTEAEEDQD